MRTKTGNRGRVFGGWRRQPADVSDSTVRMPYGLMEAVALFPLARSIQPVGRCLVICLQDWHFVILGPDDDETPAEVTRWVAGTSRRWLAQFETVGLTSITHLHHG